MPPDPHPDAALGFDDLDDDGALDIELGDPSPLAEAEPLPADAPNPFAGSETTLGSAQGWDAELGADLLAADDDGIAVPAARASDADDVHAISPAEDAANDTTAWAVVGEVHAHELHPDGYDLDLDDASGVGLPDDLPSSAGTAATPASAAAARWDSVGGGLLAPPAVPVTLAPSPAEGVEPSVVPGDSVEALSIDWKALEALDEPALGLSVPAPAAEVDVIEEDVEILDGSGDLAFDFDDDAPALSLAPGGEPQAAPFDAALSGLLSIAPSGVENDEALAALTDEDQDPWAALDIGLGNLSPPPRLTSPTPAAALPALRAQVQRAPRRALTVMVGMEHRGQFFTAFSANISAQGLFVGTDRLLPVGSAVDVFLQVPGAYEEIGIRAEVRWTRSVDHPRDDHSTPGSLGAGMGLRFVNLDPDARILIDRYVRASDDPIFDG